MQGQAQSPLFIAAVRASRLDDIAAGTFHGSPEAIARLGFAIAHYLNQESPLPFGLDEADNALASRMAAQLRQAKRPLIVSGTSGSSLAVIQAAYNVAKALPAQDKGLIFALPEANSLGLAMLGGKRLEAAFARVKNGSADTVVILENDLYRRAPQEQVDDFLNSAQQTVAIDHLENTTTAKAGLLLPAATFAESEGTLVSNEGRAQRYFPVYPAKEPVLAAWQWLSRVIEKNRWSHFGDLSSACAAEIPALAGLARLGQANAPAVEGKIPRQPHRYSGRTAMYANIEVSEPPSPEDHETPFAFSMEGDTVHAPPAMVPVVWAPGWNSNQAIGKFQDEIGGPLHGGDPGTRLIEASGTLPWFDGIPPAYTPDPKLWRVIRLPNIFAGEELSRHSPPIAERLPDLCIFMNPVDAEALAVRDNDPVEIADVAGFALHKLPVRIEPTLSPGLLGVTAGLPPFQNMRNDARVVLKKASVQEEDRL